MISFKIAQLKFSGEDEIAVEEDSLLLLVGPNSSGKSTALSNIETALASPGHKGQLVVDELTPEIDGGVDEFREWISAHYPSAIRNLQKTYLTKGQVVTDVHLNNDWKQNLNTVIHFLSHRLNTEERLQIVKPKGRVDRGQDPSEYIHMLQADSALLKSVSKDVKEAFQRDLIINWSGGRHVWFHVGDEPDRDGDNDRVSNVYLDELDKLPRLENEGDGIKSFVGCLLGIRCGAHKVLMIDEPEAFLHPPQARKLGRIMAESASDRRRQVVAATHSPDVVIGALASNGKVSVCRVDRDGDVNRAYLLDSNQLSELWSKPLLQSTGAINGVFHKGIVVCEADADCRFFEALLDRLEAKVTFNEATDLYFIHGGGKGEINTLLAAYQSLNIKTAGIADFDVLRNEAEIKKIWDTISVDFDTVSADYTSAVAALNDLPPIKSLDELSDKATEIIDTAKEAGELTGKAKAELSEVMAQSSKWSEAKNYGINKLKGGQAVACQNVLNTSAANGFYIVPEGELESWWRQGPATKAEWIIAAIDLINSDPDSFAEAEQFLLGVLSYFGYEVVPDEQAA